MQDRFGQAQDEPASLNGCHPNRVQAIDEIADDKIPKDMLELASHIVETKSGHFKPEKFEDHYEDALKEASEKEAVWSEDRSAKRACPGESDQSHGCATPKRGRGAWWRWARRRRAACSRISSDAEESRTIERTQGMSRLFVEH